MNLERARGNVERLWSGEERTSQHLRYMKEIIASARLQFHSQDGEALGHSHSNEGAQKAWRRSSVSSGRERVESNKKGVGQNKKVTRKQKSLL